MGEQNTITEAARDNGLNDRVSGLNEIGAHYLVGWLVSAGFQRPEVMAEIEWVLEDMETDPNLRHCWLKEEAQATPANAATECVASPEADKAAIQCESAPLPAADLAAPPNPLAKSPIGKPEPARRSLFPARFREAIFGRPRIAA